MGDKPVQTIMWPNKYCRFYERMFPRLYQWNDNKRDWFCSEHCHDEEKKTSDWRGIIRRNHEYHPDNAEKT